MNILLALRMRDLHGVGSRLDISMSDNLFAFMYWAIGSGTGSGRWPTPAGEMLTGGTPRYRIYRTRDDRFIAVAPLEQQFWVKFCEAIGLRADLRDDTVNPKATLDEVATLIRSRTAAEWQEIFKGQDVCCTVVATLEEAVSRDPHFQARGLFQRRLKMKAGSVPALVVPIASVFRGEALEAGYPELGEDNGALLDR